MKLPTYRRPISLRVKEGFYHEKTTENVNALDRCDFDHGLCYEGS